MNSDVSHLVLEGPRERAKPELFAQVPDGLTIHMHGRILALWHSIVKEKYKMVEGIQESRKQVNSNECG